MSIAADNFRTNIKGFSHDENVIMIVQGLSVEELQGLVIALKLIDSNFPKADIYYAELKNYKRTFSIGKKDLEGKRGSPFLAIKFPNLEAEMSGEKATISFRTDSDKFKKSVKTELGEKSDFFESLFVLDELAKNGEYFDSYLGSLRKSASIMEKANGNSLRPDDYSDASDVCLPTFNEPKGCQNPNKKIAKVIQYDRDPKVREWVLNIAGGKCEACDCEAPFSDESGSPYLEVHHLKQLADDGSDTCSNTVSLCPNCHRKFHYSPDRKQLRKSLYLKISRLKKE